MGRKAISGTPKTETPIRVRVTDEERAILERAAELDGKPVSTWLRELGLRSAARTKKGPAK